MNVTVLIADDVACDAMARWHTLVAAGTAPADALAVVAAWRGGAS